MRVSTYNQVDIDHTTAHMRISDDTAKDIKTDNDETKDRINIEDINITTEMNTSQLAIQQQEYAKQ